MSEQVLPSTAELTIMILLAIGWRHVEQIKFQGSNLLVLSVPAVGLQRPTNWIQAWKCKFHRPNDSKFSFSWMKTKELVVLQYYIISRRKHIWTAHSTIELVRRRNDEPKPVHAKTRGISNIFFLFGKQWLLSDKTPSDKVYQSWEETLPVFSLKSLWALFVALMTCLSSSLSLSLSFSL